MRFNILFLFLMLAPGFGIMDAVAEEEFQIPYELPVYVFDPARRELVPVRPESLPAPAYSEYRDEPGYYLPELLIEPILYGEYGHGEYGYGGYGHGGYADGWRSYWH